MARTSRKQDILDAAMQLFAERGVDAVSLREVNACANMSSAALHYHFKNRDILVASLVDPLINNYIEVRTVLLDEIHSGKVALSMEALSNVLVRSLSHRVKSDPDKGLKELRFFSRLYFDKSQRLHNVFENTWLVFAPLLIKVLDQVNEQELKLRLAFSADLCLQALVNSGRLVKNANSDDQVGQLFEQYLQSLVKFIAAGMYSSDANFDIELSSCQSHNFPIHAVR